MLTSAEIPCSSLSPASKSTFSPPKSSRLPLFTALRSPVIGRAPWGGGKHNPVCFAIQDSALAIADLLILIACIHTSPPCLFLFFSSEHHLHWSPHPLEPCIASLLHHPSFRSCFQGPLEHVHCYDRCTGV